METIVAMGLGKFKSIICNRSLKNCIKIQKY